MQHRASAPLPPHCCCRRRQGVAGAYPSARPRDRRRFALPAVMPPSPLPGLLWSAPPLRDEQVWQHGRCPWQTVGESLVQTNPPRPRRRSCGRAHQSSHLLLPPPLRRRHEVLVPGSLPPPRVLPFWPPCVGFSSSRQFRCAPQTRRRPSLTVSPSSAAFATASCVSRSLTWTNAASRCVPAQCRGLPCPRQIPGKRATERSPRVAQQAGGSARLLRLSTPEPPNR
mmetsp:Transcript_11018/g.34959  ORF Transcript_11018/g.34959 Transcript_11018/m.34959 type:complete len:226 (-) Transcript_11018:72-749(-)